MPFYHVTRGERLLYVYQPLVGRATKKKIGIAERLNERTVNKDIQILQQGHHYRVALGKQGFPCITGITPDSLVRILLYLFGKFGTSFCLKKWVTSGKGNMSKGVVDNNTHQVVNRDFLASFLVPRLGIVAPWASMVAPCQIDTCTETRTIHRGIL